MPDRFVRRADGELVDAVRYDGGNAEDVRRLAGVALGVEGDAPGLRVGGVEVRAGDWVMRDDDGRVDLVRPSELYSLFRPQPVE